MPFCFCSLPINGRTLFLFILYKSSKLMFMFFSFFCPDIYFVICKHFLDLTSCKSSIKIRAKMEKYYAITFTSIQSNNLFCKVVHDFM